MGKRIPEVYAAPDWPSELSLLADGLQVGYSNGFGVHKANFMEGYGISSRRMATFLRRLRPLFAEQGFALVLDEDGEYRLQVADREASTP